MAGAKAVRVQDWWTFCRLVDERVVRHEGRLLFRGQADPSWPLASVWERFLLEKKRRGDHTDARHVRDRKLVAFREYASAIGLQLPQSDLECWAIGRHFGLVTPLLDWSSNPYVAAFFAWLSRYENDNGDLAFWGATEQNWGRNDVVVWELRNPSQLIKKDEFQWISDISYSGDRQRAQEGSFTILDHSDYADLESYLSARGLADHLTKYEMAGAMFKDAFVNLAHRNLNYATLLPDWRGAALQANIDAVVKLFTAVSRALAVSPPSNAV